MVRNFLLLAAFVFFYGSNSFSQDLEVSPARIVFNAAPGEAQSRVLNIKNHSNHVETVTFRLHDFLIQRHGGRERLTAGSTRNSISNWISLNPSFVELQPNETKSVQVNLQASTDDQTAKWGILSILPAVEQTAFSVDAEMQTGITISGRIDISLFYNPNTGDHGNVEIGNLQEIPSTNNSDRTFTVNLDNIGEQIVNCKVYLIASNLNTGEEHTFSTLEIMSFPQAARTVELTMPDDLPPGRYALAAILDYPGSTSLKGTQITINVE